MNSKIEQSRIISLLRTSVSSLEPTAMNHAVSVYTRMRTAVNG